MCGIWSIAGDWSLFGKNEIEKIIQDLFLLSEVRGKDATGIMSLTEKETVVFKRNVSAKEMIKTREYKDFLQYTFEKTMKQICFSGHSRLATNGTQELEKNNQPIAYGNVSTVHNGIIVNLEEVWQKNGELHKETEVDTEIFVKLLDKYQDGSSDLIKAVIDTYNSISGMASTINIMGKQRCLLAATNNGSLYYMCSKDKKKIILASERNILNNLLKKNPVLNEQFNDGAIIQVKPNSGILFDIERNILENFKFADTTREPYICEAQYENKINLYKVSEDIDKASGAQVKRTNWSRFDADVDSIKKIRRCTKCLLPETMPFIKFDSEGVCNYCATYKKQTYKKKEELDCIVEDIKKKNNDKLYDSLVSFSGGRDSSYGLHYFVKELGLRPVAYSYDWGMVTDLARRNQSRMCSQLGIELILVAADIRKKRANIRKNVSAWLKKPDLGMVPLFMAGDKQYFYYANKVCKEYGIEDVLLASNPFEKTHFKSGFCGVKPAILRNEGNEGDLEALPMQSVMRMAGHYAGQFLKNPYYFNSSLLDTVGAAISYYMIPHNYFRIFDYMPWDEKKVDKVLLNEYDWEKATDTESTWRIGDGTAPFYNYIYYTVCGFSENDTLRSNQIREGMITREEGLELVYRDNKPRFESMQWYFDTIGVDMEEALKVIKDIPKLY